MFLSLPIPPTFDFAILCCLLQRNCSKKQFTFTFSLYQILLLLVQLFSQAGLTGAAVLPGSALSFRKKPTCIFTQRWPVAMTSLLAALPTPSLHKTHQLAGADHQSNFWLEDCASHETDSRNTWNWTCVVSFSLLRDMPLTRSHWFSFIFFPQATMSTKDVFTGTNLILLATKVLDFTWFYTTNLFNSIVESN